MAGVDYIRSIIEPEGYSVALLDTNDPHAMHIDATILTLRQGLLVFNPERVTESALRRLPLFADWELIPYPHQPKPRSEPPLYMTSAWLVMNVLSLDEKTLVIEAGDTEFKTFVEGLGFEAIPCEFKHVNSIGGSFHCATVDLVRD